MSRTPRVPWGVVAALLSETQHDEFVARTRKEYETVRIQHARKKPRTPPVTLAAARDNDLAFDWESYTPPVAHRLACRTLRPVSKRCATTSTGRRSL